MKYVVVKKARRVMKLERRERGPTSNRETECRAFWTIVKVLAFPLGRWGAIREFRAEK